METQRSESLAWLTIRLGIFRRGPTVVFALTFLNSGNRLNELFFSNLLGKAELTGLWISDPEGRRITPSPRPVKRSMGLADTGRVLQPCEGWTYELLAEAADGTLLFPAAAYSLTVGQAYLVRFVYQEISSNQVAFVA